MKKTILLVFAGECHRLPPFLAIIDSLHYDYQLKVISYEKRKGMEMLKSQYKDVEFLSSCIRPETESFSDKLIRHLYYPIAFHRETKRLIKTTSRDLLWIIHERTLIEFADSLPDKDYIVSFYELNDTDEKFVKKTRKTVLRAKELITAEYNRSCIMRVWYKLDYTPAVIPNKPYYHPRKRNLECEYSAVFNGKKVILYQGHIQRVRNVNALCDAVEGMPGYLLVLMGDGDDEYVNYLKNKYKNILFVDFIAPPHHLDVTSWARIGIVKYDFTFINHLYCAPNKIWEYSGFDMPMIGNQLPGLQNTFERYHAGLCVDTESPDEIKRAIKRIDDNYEEFSANARRFYDSFDVKKEILKIVDKNIQ